MDASSVGLEDAVPADLRGVSFRSNFDSDRSGFRYRDDYFDIIDSIAGSLTAGAVRSNSAPAPNRTFVVDRSRRASRTSDSTSPRQNMTLAAHPIAEAAAYSVMVLRRSA